jgi:hypothetical protein
MVAYPFCPSWAAVGEQVTAGYAAFFFSLYRTQLSVIAPTGAVWKTAAGGVPKNLGFQFLKTCVEGSLRISGLICSTCDPQ